MKKEIRYWDFNIKILKTNNSIDVLVKHDYCMIRLYLNGKYFNDARSSLFFPLIKGDYENFINLFIKWNNYRLLNDSLVTLVRKEKSEEKIVYCIDLVNDGYSSPMIRIYKGNNIKNHKTIICQEFL